MQLIGPLSNAKPADLTRLYGNFTTMIRPSLTYTISSLTSRPDGLAKVGIAQDGLTTLPCTRRALIAELVTRRSVYRTLQWLGLLCLDSTVTCQVLCRAKCKAYWTARQVQLQLGVYFFKANCTIIPQACSACFPTLRAALGLRQTQPC